MSDLLEPEHCIKILNGLGCAATSKVFAHDCGFGQYWATGDGSPFFVQHDQASSKVLGRPFARVLDALMRRRPSGTC